jgi:hypothetical protein
MGVFFWYGHKKVDLKYLKIKILKNMSLHLVYGKLNPKIWTTLVS